jgi:hypothetical protein
MKKILAFSTLVMVAALNVSAQSVRQLTKVLELTVPSSRTEGANAGSVAWHPVSKKYYAAMAGNSSHFVGIYDTKGKLQSSEDQEALFDIRGIWYNPSTKTLQMNGYNDYGWAEYKLDKKGAPIDVSELQSGMHQPEDQSVGSYDPKAKAVYFLNEEGFVEVYKYDDGSYDTYLELHLGYTEADDLADNYDVIDDYNSTTVVYTGISGAELGLLNTDTKQIELYNIKTGLLTRKLGLPSRAPMPAFLNFAYSNGIFWLFDTEARIWKGYK